MSHKNTQVKPPLNKQVLFIGIGPEAHTPEMPPLGGITLEELAVMIERVEAVIRAEGIGETLVLTSTDPDEAETELRKRFAERSFGLADIGGGVRIIPENSVLLERIVNVLIDIQPGIQLTFNTNPMDALQAVHRWLDR